MIAKHWFFMVIPIILFAYLMWGSPEAKPTEQPKSLNTGIKWQSYWMKELPKDMDTSIVVYDALLNPLKFASYIAPVFNNEAMIYRDRERWRLHRLNPSAQDSLYKDDFAVASKERRAAYKLIDTVTNRNEKLKKIAEQLKRADFVVALKSERKILLYRKGKCIKTLTMTMGWAPVGNKVSEGDGKTPEGLYYLDDKYYRQDDFYASIKISYPNFKDREIAQKRGVKAGYGVLIHGTKPSKIKAKNWTAGCIALQNNDMDTLFRYVGEGTSIHIKK